MRAKSRYTQSWTHARCIYELQTSRPLPTERVPSESIDSVPSAEDSLPGRNLYMIDMIYHAIIIDTNSTRKMTGLRAVRSGRDSRESAAGFQLAGKNFKSIGAFSHLCTGTPQDATTMHLCLSREAVLEPSAFTHPIRQHSMIEQFNN